MSWKPQVKVNGNWEQNNVAFATEEEAAKSAADLFDRWVICTDHRAAESDETVNYRLVEGRGTSRMEPLTGNRCRHCGEIPEDCECSRGNTRDPEIFFGSMTGHKLDVPELTEGLQAAGLNVQVIDENTDFSKLPSLAEMLGTEERRDE